LINCFPHQTAFGYLDEYSAHFIFLSAGALAPHFAGIAARLCRRHKAANGPLCLLLESR
jgi:hypothetical protein